MLVASAAPVAVAGYLGGCEEAKLVRGGEVGDSGTDTGKAQRTRLMLLLLLSPPPPSESLVTREPSLVRAIPTSKVLYGLRRVLDLITLGEVARTMTLRCLVIPMRFVISFSIAGIRIERSLWSSLHAIAGCVARGRASMVSRVTTVLVERRTFGGETVGAWAQASQRAAAGEVDTQEQGLCGQIYPMTWYMQMTRVSKQSDDGSRDAGGGGLLKGSRWPVPSIISLSGSPQHKECGTYGTHQYQPLPFWDKVGLHAGTTAASPSIAGHCNPLEGRLDNYFVIYIPKKKSFCPRVQNW